MDDFLIVKGGESPASLTHVGKCQQSIPSECNNGKYGFLELASLKNQKHITMNKKVTVLQNLKLEVRSVFEG